MPGHHRPHAATLRRVPGEAWLRNSPVRRVRLCHVWVMASTLHLHRPGEAPTMGAEAISRHQRGAISAPFVPGCR